MSKHPTIGKVKTTDRSATNATDVSGSRRRRKPIKRKKRRRKNATTRSK